ncbi:hypothetical protein [Helicobacter winghamensis]|uniref:hypothetical protein n=1 Tax=Helicobacter winghamensis TaxID=157268 RepID=UPI00351BE90B
MNKSNNRRDFLKNSLHLAGGLAFVGMGANTLLAQDSKVSKFAVSPYPSGANLANNPYLIQIPSVKLNNGIFMPILGFGTLKLGNQKETQKYVEQALEVGLKGKSFLSLLSFLNPMRQRIRQEKPMMRA